MPIFRFLISILLCHLALVALDRDTYALSFNEAKNQFIQSFHAVPSDDDEREYRLTYKDHSIRIFIGQFMPDNITFVVRDPKLKESIRFDSAVYDTDCLNFDVRLNDHLAFLVYLSSKNKNCNLPEKAAGIYLLEFSEAIAKALNIKEISLKDTSSIYCTANDGTAPASMRVFHILKTGKTWYSQHGFTIHNNQWLKEDFNKMASILHTYPLKDIKAELQNAPSRISNRTFIADLELLNSQIDRYSSSLKDNTFGEFMTLLWNEDCSSYLRIERTFMRNLNIVFPFQWAGSFFYRLDWNGFEWSKYLGSI